MPLYNSLEFGNKVSKLEKLYFSRDEGFSPQRRSRNKGKLYPFEVKYRESIDGIGKWIRKRFDEDIRPVIVSKDKFEIRENCAIIPASFFLYLI